ncbi:MAG: hypothetical protein AAF938_07840 [Myxococcota bacterium]
MTQAHEKLEALEDELAARGADGVRLSLVRRARNFKRSWVEMAEALSMVRRKNLYLEWGYQDFHSYCQRELLLTRATVDKLTGTFAVMQEHAPQVLQRDGIAQPIPSMASVDYFAKALRGAPENDDEFALPDEQWDELRHAVFDDNQPVAVLKKNYDSVFFAKPEGAEVVETLEKTRAAARRLEGLLARATPLSEETVREAMASIAALREAIDAAIPEAKANVKRAS